MTKTFKTKRERTKYVIEQIEELIDCIESMEDAEEVKKYISHMLLCGYITFKRWDILMGYANQAGEIAEGTHSWIVPDVVIA